LAKKQPRAVGFLPIFLSLSGKFLKPRARKKRLKKTTVFYKRFSRETANVAFFRKGTKKRG